MITLQEAFQDKNFYMAEIGFEICPHCGDKFTRLTDGDPGSHEQAIIVAFACDDCSETKDSYLFDFESHHFRNDPNQAFEEEIRFKEEVSLENEKWDDYWSDYNQCGVRIDN